MQILLLSLLLAGIGTSANAQLNCESGRAYYLNFPTCADKDQPVELTKSCRNIRHGREDQPYQPPALVQGYTPFIPGGSGKTQEQLCRENQAFVVGEVKENETVTFKGTDPDKEDPSKTITGNAVYRYYCQFEKATYLWKNEVSEYCVPENERYKKVESSACLNDKQAELLATIEANNGYDLESLKLYLATLPKATVWQNGDQWSNTPLKEMPAPVICTDCSNIPAGLEEGERLAARMECLKTIVKVYPRVAELNEAELQTLKGYATEIDEAAVQDLFTPSEDDVDVLDFILK